jgi:hypothetical protein
MLRVFALACLSFVTSPGLAEPLRLPGGMSTAVPGSGLSLTMTKVQDQRCPPDVDCFWEGMIRLEMTLSHDLPDGPPDHLIVLCNLCEGATREATVAGLTFALQGLDPSTADLAALGRTVKLTDYTALVTVAAAP